MGTNDNYKGMNWDLTSYFPEFKGGEYNSFKETLTAGIESVLDKAKSLEILDNNNLSDWGEIFIKSEDLIKNYSHIRSYVGCLSAADSNNED